MGGSCQCQFFMCVSPVRTPAPRSAILSADSDRIQGQNGHRPHSVQAEGTPRRRLVLFRYGSYRVALQGGVTGTPVRRHGGKQPIRSGRSPARTTPQGRTAEKREAMSGLGRTQWVRRDMHDVMFDLLACGRAEASVGQSEADSPILRKESTVFTSWRETKHSRQSGSHVPVEQASLFSEREAP
jgi:hypothetical protein